MLHKLLCFLGIHNYMLVYDLYDKPYLVCKHCRRVEDIPK